MGTGYVCYVCMTKVKTLYPVISYTIGKLKVDICDICCKDIHDYAEQKRLENIYDDKREV